MKQLLFLLTATLCVTNAWAGRTLFDRDWRFFLGDAAEAKSATFDDSQWRVLTLPHDWSTEHDATASAPAGNDGGYRLTGTGWYRKAFTLSKADTERSHRLYFEGVYMNAEVYVNGQLAGGHPYGYTSFFVDVSPFVQAGRNVVAVRVDNSQQKNCRWYSGSGIYRHVWLVSSERLHVQDWGVAVTTRGHEATVSTTIVNETDDEQLVTVSAAISGTTAADSRQLSIPAHQTHVQDLRLNVDGARPWSPDAPNVYRAVVTLQAGGQTIDTYEQEFGFRTIEYDAEHGLRLNGQPLLLNGACAHHDNGILGAAAFDRAEWRKAELLKQAGFNAVRTSHNPPSEAFLTACDHVGLLVVDEAFDGWREQKNAHDYATLIDEWWQRDLTAMVVRDRNHPAVFCWSTGNEVMERKKLEVVRTAHLMACLCRLLDPERRPVTSALASWDSDWEIYDPLAAEHDIVGYNYMIHKAEGDHERQPQRVMMQTESYPRDAWKNYVMARDHSYIVGDFVWTGIDYLGESGIGRWYYEGDVPGEHYTRPLYPWNAAYCGDIDLTGWRKPISHYRQLLWSTATSAPAVYMAVREPDGYYGAIKETLWSVWPTWESWNWPGWEGKPISVEVYTRQPSVQLYLNGQLVGEQPTSEMKATFTLPYAEGTLEARAMADGQPAGTATLQTAGEPAALRLTADRTQLASDGQDLCFVTVEVVDAEGRVCPNADPLLHFTVSGAATLQAAGNADIKDTAAFTSPDRKAWKGRALAVVRTTDKPGRATLSVAAPGLPTARLTIATKR